MKTKKISLLLQFALDFYEFIIYNKKEVITMKDGLEYEKGDLSPKKIKEVYEIAKDNSISQKHRNLIISDRLKELRITNRITQKELCEDKKVNVIITTYASYEQAKAAVPTEIIARLAKYYNVSSDYIIGLSENKRGRFAEEETADIEEKLSKIEEFDKRIEKLEKAQKQTKGNE